MEKRTIKWFDANNSSFIEMGWYSKNSDGTYTRLDDRGQQRFNELRDKSLKHDKIRAMIDKGMNKDNEYNKSKLEVDEFGNSKHIFIKDQDTLDSFDSRILELQDYYNISILKDVKYGQRGLDSYDYWRKWFDGIRMYNIYNTQIVPSDYSRLINPYNIFRLESSKSTKNELLIY